MNSVEAEHPWIDRVLLLPSITPVTVERIIRVVQLMDPYWGYFLVAQMGRLNLPSALFRIQISIVATGESCKVGLCLSISVSDGTGYPRGKVTRRRTN